MRLLQEELNCNSRNVIAELREHLLTLYSIVDFTVAGYLGSALSISTFYDIAFKAQTTSDTPTRQQTVYNCFNLRLYRLPVFANSLSCAL